MGANRATLLTRTPETLWNPQATKSRPKQPISQQPGLDGVSPTFTQPGSDSVSNLPSLSAAVAWGRRNVFFCVNPSGLLWVAPHPNDSLRYHWENQTVASDRGSGEIICRSACLEPPTGPVCALKSIRRSACGPTIFERLATVTADSVRARGVWRFHILQFRGRKRCGT